MRALTLVVAVLLGYTEVVGQCNTSAYGARDAGWSCDGTKIVYSSNESGNQEIYVMNADGTKKKKLTETTHPNYYPFFSPDGSKIVFMSYREPITIIYTVDSDGSNLKRLTDENANNADPDWSPNGSKIVFYSHRDGNNEIYIMNSDGSNWTRLTNNRASDQTPSISPNGQRIVFVSDRDGNAEIYTMDLNGEDVKRLTIDPRIDRVPRWSPDSKKIIWYSREPSSVAGSSDNSWNGAEIYEMNADGTNRKQLTHNVFMDHGPIYSPDGKKILFTSCRTGNREVFIMNHNGSDIQQLTFTKQK